MFVLFYYIFCVYYGFMPLIWNIFCCYFPLEAFLPNFFSWLFTNSSYPLLFKVKYRQRKYDFKKLKLEECRVLFLKSKCFSPYLWEQQQTAAKKKKKKGNYKSLLAKWELSSFVREETPFDGSGQPSEMLCPSWPREMA